MPGATSPPLTEPTELVPEETRDSPAPRPALWRRLLTVALSLVITVATAFVLNLALNASSWPAPLDALRNRTFDPPAMVQSTATVWIVVCLTIALVGRLWLGLGLVSAFAAVLCVVNKTKLELRNDPLYPSDTTFLKDSGFLADMVSGRSLALGALALVVIVALGAATGWLLAKVFPPLHRAASRRGVWTLRIVRLLVVLLCLGLLQTATNFNEDGSRWRAAFESPDLRWRSWEQHENYKKNGFVPGFLYNMPITPMATPPGYSKAAVQKIAAKYVARAATTNAGRTDVMDRTNVVLVLSESFSDPTGLSTVKFPSNPIPKTTALMKRTLSGRMLAPGYGGGTANVEYELLTGQSLSQLQPQLSTPYQQMVSRDKSYPSAVEWFERRGHTPVAIHPFAPKMYDRPTAYKSLGFDAFITKDQMSFKRRGGGTFIDDESSFNETLKQIDTSDKPVLAHLVTMQNHMPYGGQYTDPIVPSGLPDRNARLAGQYARGLARTDEALASFLEKLEGRSEPTTVVFYGDHLPAQIYPADFVKREGWRAAHQTPFLLWSNTRALRPKAVPTTSPIQFLPMLFDAMQARVPPWFALLSDLGKQVPAMDGGFAIDAQNQRVRPEQLSAEAKSVLADYRMIMYDLSVGKRYTAKTMYGDAPAG